MTDASISVARAEPAAVPGFRLSWRHGLAVVGLALMAGGQYLYGEDLQKQFVADPRLISLPLPDFIRRQVPAIVALVVGGVLAAIGLRGAIPEAPVDEAIQPASLSSRWRIVAVAMAAISAVALLAVSIDSLNPPFRELRLIGLAIALVGGLAATAIIGRTRPSARLPFDLFDLLWIGGILAYFLATTLPTLTDPRWSIIGDEYAFFDIAYQIAAGPLWDPFGMGAVYGVHPTLSSDLQAITMRIFGYDHFGWKMAGVLVMVVSIAATYLAARWLLGRPAAQIASALIATTHYLYAYTHTGTNNIDAVLPVALLLCFMAGALRTEWPLLWYLAGAATGLSLGLYFPARVTGLIIAGGMLARGWRPFWRGLAPALAGTLLFLLPFAAVNKLSLITIMFGQGVTQRGINSSPLQFAYDTIVLSFWSILPFLNLDANHHYLSLGLFDQLSSTLSLLGIFIGLATLRDWRSRLLILSLAATLFVSGGMNLHPFPSESRLQTLVPIFAILAGLAFSAILRRFAGLIPARTWPIAATAAVVVAVVVMAAVNLNRFREVSPSRYETHPEMPVIQALFSDACRQAGPVPIVFWSSREGLFGTAVASYSANRYLPLIMIEEVYRDIPAYQSWPCLVIGNSQGEIAVRVAQRARERNPNTQVVRFTLGAGQQDAIAIIQPGSDAFASAPLPAVGRQLYAIQHTSYLGGTAPGALEDPSDVTIGPNNHFFVSDMSNRHVAEFDDVGRFVRNWGDPATLKAPFTVAADANGLVVLDYDGGQFVSFDASGRVQARHRFADLKIVSPRGIAIGRDGRIAVADEAQGIVFLFDRAFNRTGVLLEPGTEPNPAAPLRPTDVEVGADGSVYVYDGTTGRARRYAPDGTIVGTWDVGARDARLAVAPDGSFWLAVPGGIGLTRFSANGERLVVFGPGDFRGDSGEATRAAAIDDRGVIQVVWRTQNVISYRILE